jgi:hypothetical protein
MKRIIAFVLAGAMSLAAVPAFAQTTPQQPGQNPDQVTNPQHVDASGLGTFDQAPPTDGTPYLIIGGVVLTGAALIAYLASHHSDNNPVSP